MERGNGGWGLVGTRCQRDKEIGNRRCRGGTGEGEEKY
jgi:hypothetical protein